MKVLVSACLLGENCKYSGGNNYNPAVAEFCREKDVIPVCPEVLAGLGIPRIPIEIADGRLMDREGNCVDEKLRGAVNSLLKTLPLEDIQCAILQSRSPTCGVKEVYDGSFTGKRIPGSGVFVRALMDAGCCVMDAEDI